jgi:hypothetical protein
MPSSIQHILRKPTALFGKLARKVATKRKVLNRRKLLNITTVITILAAVGVAWGLILFSGQTNMADPAAVAEQFTLELQADRPHTAYTLTSSAYHKNVKEADFTKGIAASVNQQLSTAKPQPFSTATPPPDKNGKKDTSQARVLINIPKDSQTEAHKMAVLMVKEHEQWYVQAFTLVLGEATREDADASSK